MSHGQLNLVSVGPGSSDLIPPMARLALERSDVVVGYGLYLQWIAPWLDGKEVHDLPLTKERERAALALRLAREGRVVSLVSSGDIGVYGLAPLVFEMLEAGEGTDIRVIPGITAALSCASLLGAPLGHDFATLSLSDLLCPWDWILGRAEQIAKTDIALALYNIQSEARREGVYRVLDILMKYRPRDTWCGVVRNAYREGAEVSVCTLAELRERRFDMLTTLIIGTRFTQKTGAYLFSPRGYHGWQFNDSPPKRAVWFFTGTRDGNALASECVALGNSTVVSVASEFGADQARRQVKGAHVVTGGKGAAARRSLFAASEVAAVVDATHPFATVISRQLIDHCAALGIPYLRYERPRVDLPDDVQVFDSIEMAALAAKSNYRRVFLATGVRHLSIFVNQPDSDHCQWFARVNPNSESISKALDSGILPARLCAMQGPFSQRANEVLWADWNIDCVVTKDSGDTGGLPAKIAAARALQIPLLIVRRPAMNYPDLTSDSSAVTGWLQKLSSESTKQLLTSI
jgi:precorrin-6x reductase